MTRLRSCSAYLSILALWFVGAASAYAMCDILPDAEPDFRGRRGLVDRAFAGPGRWIAFSDNPSCNSGLPSFAGDYPEKGRRKFPAMRSLSRKRRGETWQEQELVGSWRSV